MKQAFIIASDPPHSNDLDVQRAAELFGCDAAELRLRTAYPAPQPWFIDTERTEIDGKLEALQSMGFSATLLSLSQFSALAQEIDVNTVDFEEPALLLNGVEGPHRLEFNTPLIAVYAKPVIAEEFAAEQRAKLQQKKKRAKLEARQETMEDLLSGFGVAGAIAGKMSAQAIDDPSLSVNLQDPTLMISAVKKEFENAFIDLITIRDREFVRFRIYLAALRQGRLGEAPSGNFKNDIERFLSNIEARFRDSLVDRRLVNVSCRDPLVDNKRFSAVVKEFEPTLNSLNPIETASRTTALVCLRRLVDSASRSPN